MGRVHRLKKRADSLLEEVFRSLFEEIDAEKIRRDVDKLKEQAPDFEPVEHAKILVRRTAIRCAAAGAVTGLPSGLLAIGNALAPNHWFWTTEFISDWTLLYRTREEMLRRLVDGRKEREK